MEDYVQSTMVDSEGVTLLQLHARQVAILLEVDRRATTLHGREAEHE